MTVSEFKSTYLPFQRKMFSTAYRLLGNGQDAEDLVQDVFLKLWQKRDTLPTDGNPAGFCITLTRNLCVDRLRRQHLQIVEHEPQESDAPKSGSGEDELISAESTSTLMNLIARLPERQRIVMVMRDVDGLDYADIAASTGLTEVNVRVTLSRARKFVAEKLKPRKK